MNAQVILKPIENKGAFEDAVKPGALYYACAQNANSLMNYFSQNDAPFQPDLTQQSRDGVCHIWYTPTIPDFRAHAESDPIDELVFTLDARSYLVPTETRLGGSLDIAKAAASRPFGPRVVRLQTKAELEPARRHHAVARHFGAQSTRVVLHHQPMEQPSAWTQDYIKSGAASNRSAVLIPRHSYEGDPANGPKLDPLLDSMEQPLWIRSHLSWDGGDLLLARDPGDLSKLVLYFGDAAKRYWGNGLSVEEYGYVLMREFGADESVYVGEIASHVDYALNFLPDGKTAVLAAPVTANFHLSRSALALLIKNHGQLPVLAELQRLHAAPDDQVLASRQAITASLKDALAAHPQWPRPLDVNTLREAERYAERYCPHDHTQCSTTQGLKALLERDPDLASRWTAAASRVVADSMLPNALLGIIASQIAEPDQARLALLSRLKAVLEGRGFRVVHGPVIGGGRISLVPWAGISYVNFLALGPELLTPMLGLGDPEMQLLQRFQEALSPAHRVVAIYARAVLVRNGGIHCVAGIRRSGWENGDWPAQLSEGLPRWRLTLPLRLSPRAAEE